MITKLMKKGFYIERKTSQYVEEYKKESEYFESQVPFDYDDLENKRETIEIFKGLKGTSHKRVIITYIDLPFKKDDKVKIGNDTYYISSVDYILDDKYKVAVALSNGFESKVTTKILVLS